MLGRKGERSCLDGSTIGGDGGERKAQRREEGSLPDFFLWEREILSVSAGMLASLIHCQYLGVGRKYLDSDCI